MIAILANIKLISLRSDRSNSHDLWIFDRYLLVSHTRLLFVSALLAIIAAIWNRKLPAARP